MHDGPTIVVSHHAPVLEAVAPREERSLVTAAHASELSGILDLQPDVLLCRHPHRSFSQRRGRTRLLSNPAGYADENRYFDPLLTLELGHD